MSEKVGIPLGGGAGSPLSADVGCDHHTEAAEPEATESKAVALEPAESEVAESAATESRRLAIQAALAKIAAVSAADIDQQVSRARATYVGIRLKASERAAEEREKWVAGNPVLPGMTHEQRAQRSKAKKNAFSEINGFFGRWQDSAYRSLVEDLKAVGRLPAELQPDYVPRIRLEFWGRCIRTQRVEQRLKAKDFCRELDVSEATLRRMEKGDPMVAVISYLKAMGRLGILTRLIPEPPDELWRVKDDWARYCYRSRRPRDGPFSGVRRVRDPSPG